jgi:hypothetical protein
MWNVLKGPHFHNRMSAICGEDSPNRPLLPESRGFRDDGIVSPHIISDLCDEKR